MFKKILVLFIVIIAGLSRAETPLDRFSLPFYHWSQSAIQYLIIENPELKLRFTEQPYSFNSVMSLLSGSNLQRESGLNYYASRSLAEYMVYHKYHQIPKHQGQMAFLSVQPKIIYSDQMNPTEKLRIETDIFGRINIHKRLSAQFQFQFDTDGLKDPDYHGVYEWKDQMVGDMQTAYLMYSAKNWSLLAGRQVLHWGPGHTGSLLTSGFAPSLDMIHFKAQLGRFQFQGFNSILGRGGDTEEKQNINRYFSGHRLSYRFNFLELGFHETMMYGGPEESMHGGYLNIIIPYYLTDVMQVQKRKDNVTLAMDASLYYPENWRFYGQLAVDEYYYEQEHYPNQTAWLAGFDWIEGFGWNRLWLTAEYVRISRWIYNYGAQAYWNRLNYYNSILGHPLGPDSDLLYISAELLLTSDIVLCPKFRLKRQGETIINSPLIVSNELENHRPPFPFGIVEKTQQLALELSYTPSPAFRFKGIVLYNKIENYINQENINKDYFCFRIDTWIDWSILSLFL